MRVRTQNVYKIERIYLRHSRQVDADDCTVHCSRRVACDEAVRYEHVIDDVSASMTSLQLTTKRLRQPTILLGRVQMLQRLAQFCTAVFQFPEKLEIHAGTFILADSSPVVMALDSQLDGCEFDSRPLRCRVTTLGRIGLVVHAWLRCEGISQRAVVLLPWARNEPGELSQWPRHDDSTINIVIGISIGIIIRQQYS